MSAAVVFFFMLVAFLRIHFVHGGGRYVRSQSQYNGLFIQIACTIVAALLYNLWFEACCLFRLPVRWLYFVYSDCLYGGGVLLIQIACTVVAVLLHYLWLVVFFLMLCEGLDVFISIVIVFATKSVLVWFLCLAYGT